MHHPAEAAELSLHTISLGSFRGGDDNIIHEFGGFDSADSTVNQDQDWPVDALKINVWGSNDDIDGGLGAPITTDP